MDRKSKILIEKICGTKKTEEDNAQNTQTVWNTKSSIHDKKRLSQ